MDEAERKLHLVAGVTYGRTATCGSPEKPKIDYKSEETAVKAAASLTAKRADGKVLEAYPCFWCSGWHIGRKMTDEEREQFQDKAQKLREK